MLSRASLCARTPGERVRAVISPGRLRLCLLVVLASASPLTGDNAQHTAAVQQAQLRLLHETAWQNPEHQRLLNRAINDLDAGRTNSGLERLQFLLDQPHDSFVRSPSDDSRLTSLRNAVRRVLERSEPGILQAYERRFGHVARSRLDELLRSGHTSRLHEVMRRYFCTDAGFVAGELLARRLVDSGRYREAAVVWERLIYSPAHRARVSDETVFRLAFAWSRSGEPLNERMAELPVSENLIDAARSRLMEIPLPTDVNPGEHSVDTDWLMSHGNATRNRSIEASTPWLNPLWSHDFVGADGSATAWLIEQWNRDRSGAVDPGMLPPAVSNSPVAVGGRLIVRDFEFVNAFDIDSGRPVWRYHCATSLAASARAARLPGVSRRYIPDKLHAWTGNSVAGLLSSDGARVYAIDSIDFSASSSAVSRRNARFRGALDPGVARRRFGPLDPATILNRLVALPLATTHVQDGRVSPVWTAGGSFETPQWFKDNDSNSDLFVSREEFSSTDDAFRRLDRNNDGVIAPLEAIGRRHRDSTSARLAGHSFMGPPLPVGGRLYAVTTSEGRVNVVALLAETGEMLWSQPIGLSWGRLNEDPFRSRTAISLAWSRGVLVCPTNLRTLVGIDTTDGSLLWIAPLDESVRSTAQFGNLVPRTRPLGHAGYAAAPRIDGNQVFYLAPESHYVHCLDLHSGETLWRVNRRPQAGSAISDDDYLGAINDDIVLLVGRESCRGLDRRTGRQRWVSHFGLPSGHGLQAGENYLLPLSKGRIATIHMTNGREIGFTDATSSNLFVEQTDADGVTLPPDWVPGNLILAGQYIVSSGSERLDVFGQVSDLLADARSRLKREPESAAAKLLYAKLNLASGQVVVAAAALRSALNTSIDAESRKATEALLREILFLQLDDAAADESPILLELERISRTPYERGRFLLRRAGIELEHGRFHRMMRTAAAVRRLNVEELVPVAGNSAHRASIDSLLASLFERVAHESDDTTRSQLELNVELEMTEALLSGDPVRMDRFIRHYPWFSGTARVREDLAELLARQGDWHRAELHLLRNAASNNGRISARATARLAELLDECGLHLPAAALLRRSHSRFSGVMLDDERSWDDFRAGFARSRMARDAEQLGRRPAYDVSNVSIAESPWFMTEKRLADAFADNSGGQRTLLSVPRDLGYALFSTSSGTKREIAIVDLQSGTLQTRVEFPSRPSVPSVSRKAHVGHFLPVVSGRTLWGLSLLRPDLRKVVWQQEFNPPHKLGDIIRIGPAGPTFCSFQTRDALVVGDPATGRILWQRRDIPLSAGLISNPRAGLFGDDKALVLLDSDHTGFTVFHTATGEAVRRARLDVSLQSTRCWKFGRRLAYVSNGPAGREFCIRDPLTGRDEFRAPIVELRGRQSSCALDQEHVAAVVDPGRLVIINVPQSRTVTSIPLDDMDWGEVQKVQGFADDQRFYVNLTKRRLTSSRPRFSLLTRNLDRGELHVIDRRTGRLLWNREITARSIVEMPWYDLPFLVSFTHYVEDTSRQHLSLTVDVLDAAAGNIIGHRGGLYADRHDGLVRVDYDPERFELNLLGLKTHVRLHFPPVLQTLDRVGP